MFWGIREAALRCLDTPISVMKIGSNPVFSRNTFLFMAFVAQCSDIAPGCRFDGIFWTYRNFL
jgi:hypothetical protein